ncbi:MAG: MFS transporter [Nocardiopsaceae bacterium]|jgi:MFS family permease|nr:MFS transporter [Nocardiopsaceae bacterium]
MATSTTSYQEVTNSTGRVFRVGEEPKQLLGYPRWVVIMAAWFAMCLAGLLEYTWGSLSGSLQAAHGWGDAPTFWLFSFYVIFESFVQICTGFLRSRGILTVRWAVIIGGVVCGVVAYAWLATSSQIWEAYISYAVLGGLGSGMIYSSCINIVAKWFPEKKGWRTGFVNGGWAYGAVPFIFAIGAFSQASGSGNMSISTVKTYIIVQGIIMTVCICLAGSFMKDPPKNWWPKDIDPLDWHKHSTRDLVNNPPSLRHYNLGEMWRTPQAKWVAISYALYVGCSLFGVAFYVPFAKAYGLGYIGVVGFAGFSLADGIFRPIYGKISEYIGRRRTMIYAYWGNVVFQLLAFFTGAHHQALLFAICAVISGGLSGANFPMTAALTADYWGETNNAINYGSVYAWKALGGSFAGGGAAFVMTGTFYGNAHYNWALGFFFGASLGALAALVMMFLAKRPTVEQMEEAVRKTAAKEAEKAKPAIA